MPLKESEKANFIQEALHHELRCLLGAATVWQAFCEANAGFDVIVAMDSAFVHARCLFTFFTEDKGGDDVSVTEFGPTAPYASSMYDEWREPLHRHVLHVAKGRTTPSNLKAAGHLNQQVMPFAQEILRLWGSLERDSSARVYRPALEEARKEAVRHAKNDAGVRTTPPFT